MVSGSCISIGQAGCPGSMDKITSADRCIRRRQLGAIILGQTKMCVDVCRLCLAFRNSSIQRLKTDSILLKILQDIFHCTKRASWTKYWQPREAETKDNCHSCTRVAKLRHHSWLHRLYHDPAQTSLPESRQEIVHHQVAHTNS